MEEIIQTYEKVSPKKAIEGHPEKFEFTKIKYEKAGTTKRVYYVEQKKSFVMLTIAEPERTLNSKIEADQKEPEDKASINEQTLPSVQKEDGSLAEDNVDVLYQEHVE